MTERQRSELNLFFVDTFNNILCWEERALSAAGIKDLSVREVHTIAAVVKLWRESRNTMSHIAAALDISVGALTTAVNTLIRKGYLVRASRPNDRRIVLVEPTQAGIAADDKHSRYHAAMIEGVGKTVSGEDLDTLLQSLEQLAGFFRQSAT